MLIVFISLPFIRPKILIFFNQFQVYTAQQVKYSGGVFFKNKNDKHTRTQRLSSFHQFLHRTKTSFVSYQWQIWTPTSCWIIFLMFERPFIAFAFWFFLLSLTGFIPMAVFRRSIGWQHWNNYSKSFSRIWAFVPAF